VLLLGESETVGKSEPSRETDGSGLAGQAFLAVVDGALALDLPSSQRRRVVTLAYQRLIGPAGPRDPDSARLP
jgi:hypothetical protein